MGRPLRDAQFGGVVLGFVIACDQHQPSMGNAGNGRLQNAKLGRVDGVISEVDCQDLGLDLFQVPRRVVTHDGLEEV